MCWQGSDPVWWSIGSASRETSPTSIHLDLANAESPNALNGEAALKLPSM